ncbi:MAG: type II secretion system protein GspG [Dehalococcoidia bacterium]
MSREQWRKWLPYAPAAAVITVIVIIVALALEGPTNATPHNQARPPEGDQVSRKERRKWLPYAPVALVILVIVVALAFHLALGGSTNAAPQNQAQPPEVRARDQMRASDLYRIGVALDQYRNDKGEFPSTHGNIQSGCNYPDLDVLCKIKDYLDPIPSDPTGDPVDNGYWYVSDGTTFTLIAGVDSPADGTPAMCEQRFYDHTKKTDLYCLTSVS